MAARAKNERIGEQDEAGPANRCIPRPERLHVRECCRLRDDDDCQTDERAHVTRTRYEQPTSAGAPTALPRISTLCVLPRPPGMRRVLRASLFPRFAAFDSVSRFSGFSSFARPSRKYV